MNEVYGMLVTAGQDDTVKVWDLCDGEQLGQLRGHRGMLLCPLSREYS
jgi:division protein 1